MSIKTFLFDTVLRWALESKISPIGWLNGYKTIIGNILSIISGTLVAVQTAFCPGWSYCGYIDSSIAFIALLMSLLIKLVGEWHRLDKAK